MVVMGGDSQTFELNNFPIRFTEGKRSGATATFPSQNLVDAFQTRNGYKVTLENNGWLCDDPEFDPQNPYVNRDPRFARTILADGVGFTSDTANILNAVDTVRDIANLGTSINQSIMDGISQMVLSLMNLGNYGKGYNLATAGDNQESVFNINANFPNANDVESIREAIMSLPNLASQYIARNRK